MKMKQSKIIKISFLTIFIILFSIFIYWSIKNQIYLSEDNFVSAIKNAGIFGPILFITLQIISTVILFLPCMLGYPAGTLAFGPLWSSIYNIFSMILGSLIIYLLVKKYGINIINELDKKQKSKKYIEKLNNEKYKKFFIIAMLLPIFPDNIICYVTSLSNINLKTYIKIICLCRPWQLIFYCYGFNQIFNFIF